MEAPNSDESGAFQKPCRIPAQRRVGRIPTVPASDPLPLPGARAANRSAHRRRNDGAQVHRGCAETQGRVVAQSVRRFVRIACRRQAAPSGRPAPQHTRIRIEAVTVSSPALRAAATTVLGALFLLRRVWCRAASGRVWTCSRALAGARRCGGATRCVAKSRLRSTSCGSGVWSECASMVCCVARRSTTAADPPSCHSELRPCAGARNLSRAQRRDPSLRSG